ncbi:MAG TPA: twin-arginine translocase TatA/TatE family subunit [Gemmatimonadaceae bacterium]|nr:twin-arginine translocase TatA/TatE family subunit [Gemmatimonadaceae bacterium]
MLGNLGPMELFIILVIVLVIFGARRVPEIGASIGKGIREFKRNISDVDRSIREPERDARVDRLNAGEATPVRREEDTTSEPKRLLN